MTKTLINPTPRKYGIRAQLDQIDEIYGIKVKAQVLELFIILAGCSKRKIDNYISARVGANDPAYTCPPAYLMAFQALINRVRSATDLPPVTLAELYHPDVISAEYPTLEFVLPEISLP